MLKLEAALIGAARGLSLALRERLERKAYLLRNHAREERRPPIPA